MVLIEFKNDQNAICKVNKAYIYTLKIIIRNINNTWNFTLFTNIPGTLVKYGGLHLSREECIVWEMIKIIRVCNIQRTIKKQSSRGVL